MKVGIVETIKTEIDNPRGAPERKQIVAQTIYTERTAELGPDQSVTAAIRRYDAFRLNPDPGSKPGDPRALEGLKVWYQVQPGVEPLVLSLPNEPASPRRLREIEYSIISRQVFVPALSPVLPALPSRIGDRWRIPQKAVRALMGAKTPTNEVVLGNFKALRAAAKGTDLVAIIALTAQTTPFQAEIQFSFPPPAPPGDDSQGSTVDARGAITEVRLAQVMATPLPDSDGRLRQTQTRELILARQRDSQTVLTVPDSRPIPTEANSWLAYVDARRRFHFYHPQTLLDDSPPGADSVELVHLRPEGPDVVGIQLQPKTGDAEADKRNLDPEFHRKTLAELWRQDQQDVVAGTNGWLPKADWEPLGMKVYRIEAALRLAARTGTPTQRRIHLDYYLVLTSRPESLVVNATTVQDPPIEFRKQTEAMIKTFRFGPP
jgi:hypothetical protein